MEHAIDVLLAQGDPSPKQQLAVAGPPSAAAVESVFTAEASGNPPPVQPVVNGHRSETVESASVDVGWAWVGVLGLLWNAEVQNRRDCRPRGRIPFTP
jgi:hypothetical protein